MSDYMNWWSGVNTSVQLNLISTPPASRSLSLMDLEEVDAGGEGELGMGRVGGSIGPKEGLV